MKRILHCLIIIALALTAVSCNKNQQADMIITNAKIWTGNDLRPLAEAMAVSGDTLVAVGTNRDILKFRGSNTVVTDMNGKFVTPGFIDSHVHFLQGGLNLTSVQLRDASTPEDFVRRIGEYARTLKPGAWILGGDWDGKGWEKLPERGWIDSVTPYNPVFVSRLDGHMGLANSLAMKMASVDRKVKDIAGGTIVRDASGNLTGVFKDNAMNLIFGKIPPSSPEETESALIAAMEYFASNGVTSVQAVDASAYADAIDRVRNRGKQITRIYVMTPIHAWSTQHEKISIEGNGDTWVRTGGVKGFVDGSLGSHTAAFIEPYSDLKTDSGFFVNSEEDLYRWLYEADREGLQAAIHAIGDRAINFLLDTYERIGNENGVKRPQVQN